MTEAATKTPAERLRGLSEGQIALLESPFAMDDSEKFELLVKSISSKGVVTLDVHYMGIFLKAIAGKPNDNGSITWVGA